MSVPLGYRFAATYAGIRKKPKLDLALMVSDTEATAAGVFTRNLVRAAPVPDPGVNYGIFMLAISPSIFLDREVFRDGVSELIERIKSARRAEGIGEILIPGERAFREREIRLREGIEVDEALWQELERLSL